MKSLFSGSGSNRAFKASMILKGIDGVLELVGGVLVVAIPADTLYRWLVFLTERELDSGLSGWIAEKLGGVGESLAGGGKAFGAIYLLGHGVIKLFLVYSLLKRKLWAYPVGIATLGLFIAFQIVHLTKEFSPGLVVLGVIDAVVIVLIAREWREQKRPSGFVRSLFRGT